ncbi:hypothetical protein [Jiulongibacter sediminis]|uniref:hypothetical protein n=1 Tax=Jiulongibacter sediminis TaxID=1605367 RepID=UPI0026EA73A0|nr:hypothetical protein [Jiulongibacter sediminis]
MKPSNETMLAFYQQLGKVFYGIAHVDGTVRFDEVEKLDIVVKNHWLPLEDTFDEFETDSAYQIEIVFSWLNENDWDQENILPDLKDFMKEHPKLFSKANRQLIYDTAEQIAESFHGMNKKEKSYLIELGHLLDD